MKTSLDVQEVSSIKVALDASIATHQTLDLLSNIGFVNDLRGFIQRINTINSSFGNTVAVSSVSGLNTSVTPAVPFTTSSSGSISTVIGDRTKLVEFSSTATQWQKTVLVTNTVHSGDKSKYYYSLSNVGPVTSSTIGTVSGNIAAPPNSSLTTSTPIAGIDHIDLVKEFSNVIISNSSMVTSVGVTADLAITSISAELNKTVTSLLSVVDDLTRLANNVPTWEPTLSNVSSTIAVSNSVLANFVSTITTQTSSSWQKTINLDFLHCQLDEVISDLRRIDPGIDIAVAANAIYTTRISTVSSDMHMLKVRGCDTPDDGIQCVDKTILTQAILRAGLRSSKLVELVLEELSNPTTLL